MDTEIQKEDPQPVGLETRPGLAQATGQFYNAFLDVYLSKRKGDAKSQQLEAAIAILPQEARALYKKGIDNFEEELAQNHRLLEQNRGDEARYLLRCLMTAEAKSDEQVAEVLEHLTPDAARYLEPTPGIAIIQVEHDLYDYLISVDIVSPNSHAIHFGSDNKGEPSFMILQRARLKKGLDEESESPADDVTVRHEFHHFVWNFLQRAKFVRESKEATPELSKAFDKFRNELCAYLIDGRNLNEIDPLALVYTEDEEIQKIGNDAKYIAFICLELAKSHDIEPATFLYPAMTARSFQELKNNFALLALKEQPDATDLATVYKLNWRNEALANNIAELLKIRSIKVSPKEMKEFARGVLESDKLSKLADLHFEVDRLGQYAQHLGLTGFPVITIGQTVLDERLTLPDETAKIILELPFEDTKHIPLNKNPEEFCLSFISFWNVDKEDIQNIYDQIINSSPEMRAAYDKVKKSIIENGLRYFKHEHGYERADDDKKRQIDQDQRRRIEFLENL